MIKTADWIVDMGPEGGNRGGLVIAEGTPEDVAGNPDSHTGMFLRPLLEGRLRIAPTKKRATGRAAAVKKTAAKKANAKKAAAQPPATAARKRSSARG